MFGLLVMLQRRVGELSDDDLSTAAQNLSGRSDGAFYDLLVRLRTLEPETVVSKLLSSDGAESLIRHALS